MKKPAFTLCSAIISSGLFAVSAAHGQALLLDDVYTVRSDPNNGRLSQSFTGAEGNGTYSYAAATTVEVRSSGTGGSRRMSGGIFYFELPELGTGLSIGNASISFWLYNVSTGGTGPGSIDAYGLGYSSTPAIDSGSYADFWHFGPTDGRPGMGISNIAKLQENVIDAADYPSGHAAGNPVNFVVDSAALGVYLNSLYDAGAQPGDYAVIRLSYDEVIDPNSGAPTGYNVIGSGATPGVNDPTLSLTAIPEPSTVALFSGLAVLGFVGLVRRRRHRA